MLFVIDQSIEQALKTSQRPDQNLIDALENLAFARRYGKHLVSANRQILNSLRQSAYLNEQSRSVYNWLYARFSELGAYSRILVIQIEIVADSAIATSRLNPDGKRVVRLPFQLLQDNELLAKTTILSEHLDDCDFYNYVANTYLVWEKMGRIPIKYKGYQGGGGATARAYNDIQNRKEELCICIIDSDRKWPDGRLGSTAKSVIDVDDENQYLCDYLILNVREVENLIATTMFGEIARRDKNENRTKATEFLEAIGESSTLTSRNHLDLKNGFKLGDIIHKHDDSPNKLHWLEFIDAIKSHAENVDEECLRNPQCTPNSECSCVVTHGFGSNILCRVIEDLLEKNSPHKIAEMVEEHLQPEWSRLGMIITAWCCAANKIYAL